MRLPQGTAKQPGQTGYLIAATSSQSKFLSIAQEVWASRNHSPAGCFARKRTEIIIIFILAVIEYANSLQSVAIIPIHYTREKGQSWLSEIYRGRQTTGKRPSWVIGLAVRFMQNRSKCWKIMEKTEHPESFFL
jgi:hypothetical protein